MTIAYMVSGVLVLALAIIGWVRGFAKQLFSWLAVLLTFIIVLIAAPMVKETVMQKTRIPEQVETFLYEKLNQVGQKKEDSSDTQAEPEGETAPDTQVNPGEGEIPEEYLYYLTLSDEELQKYGLTREQVQELAKKYLDGGQDAVTQAVQEVRETAVRGAAKKMTDALLRFSSYVLLFLLVFLLLRIAAAILTKVCELVVGRGWDRFFGMLAGVLAAVMILDAGFLFIDFFSGIGDAGIPWFRTAQSALRESPVFSVMMRYNIFRIVFQGIV